MWLSVFRWIRGINLFALLTLAVAALAIFGPILGAILLNRQFSQLEQTLFAAVGLVASIFAGRFLFERGSINSAALDRLKDLLQGADLAGLDKVEANLLCGTTAIEACRSAQTHIDFIGVAGGKFLDELLPETTDVGRRIASGGIKTRLMFLDPNGKQLQSWTSNQKKIAEVGKSIEKSINKVKQAKRARLLARTYDFMPPMRILIIDRTRILVSRYDPASAHGWDAPQLCFSARERGQSFSASFVSLYEYFWNQGTDV